MLNEVWAGRHCSTDITDMTWVIIGVYWYSRVKLSHGPHKLWFWSLKPTDPGLTGPHCICVIMLLFIAYLVIHPPTSQPKIYIGCVYTWHMIQGICPEKFTFISLVISEKCLIMLLFHSISGHTPANKSAQKCYCMYILAHNLWNMP